MLQFAKEDLMGKNIVSFVIHHHAFLYSWCFTMDKGLIEVEVQIHVSVYYRKWFPGLVA